MTTDSSAHPTKTPRAPEEASMDTEYRVIWEIDLPADSPVDAARQALAIQRDPASLATVFDVVDPEGRRVRIDLETDHPEADNSEERETTL